METGAAPAFAAGVVLVSGWLLSTAPRVFAIGIALNAVCSLLLPLTTVQPKRMVLGGESVYARALGMHDFGKNAIERARALGITNLVAGERAILAELTYQAKGTGIAVFSVPPKGVPAHHYAFTRPVSGSDFPALFVSQGARPLRAGAEPWRMGVGQHARQSKNAALLSLAEKLLVGRALIERFWFWCVSRRVS